MLPEPPPNLPAQPRDFYAGLRELLAGLDLPGLDAAGVEVDFGDSGVGVTLPHRSMPGWTIAVQVSRRAAVVLAGPAPAHFDERGHDWTGATVTYVGEVLRGEHEIEVRSGGPWRRTRSRERIDFTAH